MLKQKDIKNYENMKIPKIIVNNNKNEFNFKKMTTPTLLCSVNNNKLYYENIYNFLASKILFTKNGKTEWKKLIYPNNFFNEKVQKL